MQIHAVSLKVDTEHLVIGSDVDAKAHSLNLHRRLLPLLSERAIIGSVSRFTDPTHNLERPRGSWAPPRRPRWRALRLAPALAGLVGLSLLAAACGSSRGLHVAQLGSTTAQNSSSSKPRAASARAHG